MSEVCTAQLHSFETAIAHFFRRSENCLLATGENGIFAKVGCFVERVIASGFESHRE